VQVDSHIVSTSRTTALDPVRTAERRLGHAIEAQALADGVVELAETNIARHGGPAYCSPALIGRLMRAHERALVCDLEVRKWNQHAVAAMVAAHTNGGRTA
jgi:hypothetical protein